jgi:alpha-1,3-mannosyltransferase
LLWRTRYPLVVKLLLFGSIELCWNVYPSTGESSSLLLVCHIFVLIGLLIGDAITVQSKVKI